MSDASLLDLGIREVGAGYRRRAWSPVEVTRAALGQIDAMEARLHAWVLVDAERALGAAAKAERELLAGTDRGALHGIPIGVKDIYDVAGWPTRCGSAARADAPAARVDAAAVATLTAGGAVLLGKTVTQEFAAGVLSPPARNPWDPERIPGGSSGGSAAAVAVGACFGALGSDTGGSIRIPAAACGVAGFKPVLGQLDTAGVYPLSWSLDTIGPLARSVDDTWLMWQTMVGFEARGARPGPFSRGGLRGTRIGISRSFFCEWLQPDVAAAVENAVDTLRNLGVEIVETPWPLAAAARSCGFIINRVETAAVHERVAVEDPERFALYGPELRLRIAAGREIPATAYVQALRARTVVRESVMTLFADHNLHALVAPTLPTTAVSAGLPVIVGTGREESIGAGWTRLTMPFNATGQPVLALPCGRDQGGLPVGVQFAGRPGDEAHLFHIGSLFEETFGWSDTKPPLLSSIPAPSEAIRTEVRG